MAAALLDAALVLLLAVVTVTDLRARVVPDRVLLTAVAAAIPLCTLEDPAAVPERLLAAAGAGGFLLSAAVIRPGGMGLGDVKLAAVLGAFMGWFGWPVLFLGALAGFALGAVCAAIVLLVRRSRRPADLPFGPCMIAGAALGALPGAAALVLG